MIIKVKGVIDVSKVVIDPNDLAVPVIVELTYSTIPGDIHKFTINFSITGAESATLTKKIGNNDATVYNVTGEHGWTGKFENDSTTFTLKATNKNGTSEREIVVGGRPSVVTLYDLSAMFDVRRVAGALNKIDVTIQISNTNDFTPDKVTAIKLYYQKTGAEAWNSIDIITGGSTLVRNADQSIKEYSFTRTELTIQREDTGGDFCFYLKINVKGFKEFESQRKCIFFEAIQRQPPTVISQTFPEAEIVDDKNPAGLRYEIKVKFSEAFHIRRNTRFKGTLEYSYDSKEQIFLDEREVPGLNLSKSPYSFSVDKEQEEETKGYLYPASVSEILPCILIFKNTSGSKTEKIILFWKINDDFFDYTFFRDEVRIKTTSLIVKIQYWDDKFQETYLDITNNISLTKEKHYNPKSNKFVLRILYQDILSGSTDLFNKIKEEDNYSDNLRILIIEHKVICTGAPESSGEFDFDKLLMPHEWKYICYDKFVGASAAARISDKLSFSLRSPYLRGIRVPEKGFACYDELTSLTETTRDAGTTVIKIFDFKIFYKLSSATEVFYLDPIIKGTINSIELPSLPDDVFLIPPVLTIDPPNLVAKGEVGYQQAEGIVNLDEYGKISSVELTVLGQGYSQYKYGHQRIQSESDIVPLAVFADYCFENYNLNINREFLNIKNLSFDRDNLKASLNFGVRLSSVAGDAAAAEAANRLSAEQKRDVSEYLEKNVIEDVNIEGNPLGPYVVVSAEESSTKPLDVIWAIVSKLYSENRSSALADLSIRNQDVDPSASEIDQVFVD